ncbi:MAG: hypothetical protein AABZ12_02975 [Planctomycetota bacterium]
MKTTKRIALGVIAGSMLFNWGCLGGMFNQVWRAVPVYAALEWVSDNDGIFDLFEGGNVTAAE